MLHISSKNIKRQIRHPHLERYRLKLKDALRQPGIPAEQRQSIKERLDRLGKPRDYANEVVPPGALPNDG